MEWRRLLRQALSVPERHDSDKASESCATVGAPVPESTRLLTRIVLNFSRVFSSSGRRAKRRRACSAAATSAGGWDAPVLTQKHQLLRRLEDTSVAPSREAHGPATPPEKKSPWYGDTQ